MGDSLIQPNRNFNFCGSIGAVSAYLSLLKSSTVEATTLKVSSGLDQAGTVLTNTGSGIAQWQALPDNSNTNEIQDLQLSSHVLKITNNPAATAIDLEPYLDNTDNQTLSINGNQLSISNGNTINLPIVQYTAGNGIQISGNIITNLQPNATHSGDVVGSTQLTVTGLRNKPIATTAPLNGQVLKFNGTQWTPANDENTTYTAGTGIQINGTTISNSGDLSNTNELQSLSINGNQLTISNGNTVTLPVAQYVAGNGIEINNNTINSVWRKTANNISNTNSGNVGIGIANPTATLHLHSDKQITDNQYTENELPDVSIISRLANSDTLNANDTTTDVNDTQLQKPINPPVSIFSAFNALQITNKTSGTNETDGMLIGMKNNEGFIRLQEAGGFSISTKGSKRFIIHDEGEIGIGTSSRNALFNVGAVNKNGIEVISLNNPKGYALKAKVNRTTTKAITVQNANYESFSVRGDGSTIIGGNGISNNSKALTIRKGTEEVMVVKGDGSMMLNAANALQSGKLVEIRNQNTERFILRADGNLRLANKAINLGLTDCVDATDWSVGYLGFNIERSGTNQWKAFSDGANNGSVLFLGNIGGGLSIACIPTSNGSTEMTLNNSDIAKKICLKMNQTDLYFRGTVTAKRYIATSQGWWPDFVFDEGYKLLPLKEVEKFVKENKHLPDIPKATEVMKEGIDLGEMNAKLLQKIEELFLYIMQQEKRIEQLERRETK